MRILLHHAPQRLRGGGVGHCQRAVALVVALRAAAHGRDHSWPDGLEHELAARPRCCCGRQPRSLSRAHYLLKSREEAILPLWGANAERPIAVTRSRRPRARSRRPGLAAAQTSAGFTERERRYSALSVRPAGQRSRASALDARVDRELDVLGCERGADRPLADACSSSEAGPRSRPATHSLRPPMRRPPVSRLSPPDRALHRAALRGHATTSGR